MNKLHPIEVAAQRVGSQAELARRLGVTRQAVSQWLWPGRAVPIEHCLAIEQVTEGAVTRRDLRPDDWHRIWTDVAA